MTDAENYTNCMLLLARIKWYRSIKNNTIFDSFHDEHLNHMELLTKAELHRLAIFATLNKK